MAKDFAFMFYPGDYLRDTQCLSEKAQVAYDRIMCEHMRNISSDMNNITVSREKVNFFMKRLNEEERAELFHVLTEQTSGFQIEWVSISICKRKSYSDSRSENRKKKPLKDMKNISEVMVNEDEYIDIIDSETEISEPTKRDYKMVVVEMYKVWQKANPMYPKDTEKDYHALLQFAYKIAEAKGWKRYDILSKKELEVLKSWGKVCDFIMSDTWLRTKPLSTCLNQWQRIFQEMLAANGQTSLEAKRIKPEEYFTES
jgi:hypothetical protein